MAESIEALMQSCQEASFPPTVECVLVDEELLTAFAFHQTAIGNIGRNDVQPLDHLRPACNLLCGKRTASFLVVNSDSLVEKIVGGKVSPLAKLVELLTAKGFTVVEDHRPDNRELSVEKRMTKQNLLYNLFFQKGDTHLLLSFAYSLLGRWWTNGCDGLDFGVSSNYFPQKTPQWHEYFKNSSFCSSQKLLKVFSNEEALIDGVKINVPRHIPSFTESVSAAIYTPCNLENARHFYSSYGFPMDAESEAFRARAKRLLSLVSRVLNSLSIPFWLSSGTCLGWYRQCGFIVHSKDVDIGIFIKDYSPRILHAFQEQGLRLKHRFGKVEDSFELSFITPDNLKLDIFFFYEDEASMWNGGTQARTGKKFKYLFPKFNLCLSHLDRLTVHVPCPALPYIQANYGDTWNVKVKRWDWKASPPNVRENGVWPEHERTKVIQVFTFL